MIKIRFKDELVRIFIKTRELTIPEFCEICGITQEEYDKVMEQNNYDLIPIVKIASGMNLRVRHLFEEVK